MSSIRRHCFSPIRWLLSVVILTVMVTGCSDGDDTVRPSAVTTPADTTYTVALITRLEDYGQDYVKSLTDWFLNNLVAAQAGLDRTVSLNIEFYDEDHINLDSLARVLRVRDDLQAVIGPITSVHADIVAKRLKATSKTMVVPCATSAELIHSYAGMGFFWSLVESDITQCEVLLTRAQTMGSKKVSLIASDDVYGKTFVDWFAFQALELGLEVTDVYHYLDSSELPDLAQKALREEHDMLICTPGCIDDVATILKTRVEVVKAGVADVPQLLFSDVAFTPAMLRLGLLSEFVEGITCSSDPESGFDVAYKVRYGNYPSFKESQLYDALLLVSLAIIQMDCGLATSVNDAMRDVVAKQNADGTPRQNLWAWDKDGLRQAILAYRSNLPSYDINGASGRLDFDSELYTNVVHSVYSHWMVYNNRFVTLNHLSSDGSRRTEASIGAWNWLPVVTQNFDDRITITYPEQTDNWALLVAGSDTWENYRHQADVLNMYQILRRNGYDDEHIVLIQEDDLAFNPANDHPGQVLRFDGVDLYQNVQTDYRLSDITADDLEFIMTGQQSARLPHVIQATEGSNVLVFWSGHGTQGSFLLSERPQEQGFTTARMASLLNAMRNHHCYRKMLWLIEACYGASVAVAAESEQVPGVLMISAAGALETSKADVKVDGVYRTNRFSQVLMSVLGEHPDACYRDLYYYSTFYTTGSHITVLNAARFDNLFKTSPREFLQPITQQ